MDRNFVIEERSQAIVLKKSGQIHNIGSYGDPHDEVIEEFVHDMLAARLIRPSTRPYSSPLISVMDGG